MRPKAFTVYVTVLAALAYRAYQHRHPVDLPVAPQPEACRWRWSALRCSTGCTFRVGGGCKRMSQTPQPVRTEGENALRKPLQCLASAVRESRDAPRHQVHVHALAHWVDADTPQDAVIRVWNTAATNRGDLMVN